MGKKIKGGAMKSLKLMLFFTLVLCLALPAFGADKAKSIDELAKMFDSSGCKGCHADTFSQWEKSHHARPFMGVKDGLMLIPVVKSSPFSPKDKDGKVDPKLATLKTFPCFKCHLPQALTSAEDSVAAEMAVTLMAADKATGDLKAAEEKKDDKAAADAKKVIADAKGKIGKLQITCIVCHNERAVLHKLTLGPPAKDTVYGTKDIASHMDKTFTKGKKSVIMNQSVFCGQCHGTGPNFEADNPYQCATIYGNYLHTYIPAGGTQTCQECHMKGGDHLIAPNWNDRPGSSELLKKAIALDVQTVGYQFLYKAGTYVPLVVVNTKITHNAGHEIPNG